MILLIIPGSNVHLIYWYKMVHQIIIDMNHKNKLSKMLFVVLKFMEIIFYFYRLHICFMKCIYDFMILEVTHTKIIDSKFQRLQLLSNKSFQFLLVECPKPHAFSVKIRISGSSVIYYFS